jgi:hypothetical protein
MTGIVWIIVDGENRIAKGLSSLYDRDLVDARGEHQKLSLRIYGAVDPSVR